MSKQAEQQYARCVADITKNGQDGLGEKILGIYSRKLPEYAVYRSEGRVRICYADDAKLAATQRVRLAGIVGLRDEIEGLVCGWRNSGRGFFGLSSPAALQAKADDYDRRVGGALVQALEDDVDGARELLTRIRDDARGERIAWARFEYLLTALATVVALMFLGWAIAALLPSHDAAQSTVAGRVAATLLALIAIGGVSIATAERKEAWLRPVLLGVVAAILINAVLVSPGPGFDRTVGNEFVLLVDVLRAMAAGALGAFFSISLAIRGRTVLPDLQRTANFMDAFLRVVIGAIAGAVIVALDAAHLVQISLAQGNPVVGPLVLGFISGFAERLVPDLLEKAGAHATDGTRPASKPAAAGAASGKAAAAPPEGDQRVQAGGAAATGAALADQVDDVADDDVDVGPDGLKLEDDEIMQDAELPVAVGAVERQPS